SAPPFPPPSTAGGAQPRSRHPLHALLLDSPEGLSFPQHAAVGHSQQAGSDRTLTIQEWPPRSGAAHMMAGALAGRVLNGLSDSVAADLERAKWLSEQTIRLSPHDPELGVWYKQIGAAHLLQSHTAEAVIWLEKARN